MFFKHLGLPMDTNKMSRAIIKLSEQLEFVYNELTKILLKNPVIHMDETPFQVLEEKNRSKSYFWVMRSTEEFSNQQIAVFSYSSNRKQENISELVGDYTGAIMCDGYNAYSSEMYPQITFGSCLVHIRRHFTDITKSLQQGKESSALKAVKLLMRIFEKEKILSIKVQQKSSEAKALFKRMY
ncbi:transposase [Ligilactobacillus salivarius]|uniref:IS66 family transposase n=1 Tax=Ligilactobacillus salivarius TaxID=1624 RepID=UPI0024BA5554|nr:transposase [Ligilactobacillus salivarius]WHS20099.1 transposase [Ligilactobacillus salivarius]